MESVPEVRIALLRGVNVGRSNRIGMAALRSLFESLGYGDVRSYIQSGNLIFTSGRTETELRTEIEEAMATTLAAPVHVIIRSATELREAVASCPFGGSSRAETLVHIVFLAESPDPTAVRRLDEHRSPPDRFVVAGRDIYLDLPNGSAGSRLTTTYFETTLDTIATARNLRTAAKLADLTVPDPPAPV